MPDEVADPRADIVRAMFDSYRTGNLPRAETLLGSSLVFISPQDDHLDRAAYLERCFPTASRFSSQEILAIAVTGDDVFLMYEYELAETGERFRNSELMTVVGGQITEIQVFFGGQV